ncbi:MAG TPA: extracellular solute-binding protein [Geminicoccaceae bacterium]|nr:extracellular solute-binding protein [Geminicoccus sp.]HMU51806.1 extracellular solute-binding protein [Geminicoccaceae bacterium]
MTYKHRRSAITATRRNVLIGATALAAPAIIGRRALAESGGEVVIGVSGGDYGRLVKENIDDLVLTPQGITVIQDHGDEPFRIAKVVAARDQSKGTLDILQAEATACYRLADAGLLETLDETNVPNIKYVLPDLRTNFMVPQIYSPQVLVYNEKLVETPPTSLSDLLDPKYKDKFGISAQNSLHLITAASLNETGSASDFEAAKPLVQQLIANGLRIYPQPDAIAAALNSGEISVSLMWLARKILWRKANLPFEAAFPKEGCMLFINAMAVPKSAPNKENAFKYLNAVLEPAAQVGFARNMGYLPTSTETHLEGEVAEQLRLPDPAPTMIMPDFPYLAKTQNAMNDWWKKAIR